MPEPSYVSMRWVCLDLIDQGFYGQDIYLSVSYKKFVMLKAGDLFSAGKQGGVVGAFLKSKRGCIGVTAYHIMKLAGTKNSPSEA